jgi:glycosyltransferase involved in cell wall biosynthesis
MASGVPVLVSGAASLPEVTADCAVIIDPYSEESISDGLERLATDSELRERLSREGIERAKSFSWEKSAEKLYEIYRELI